MQYLLSIICHIKNVQFAKAILQHQNRNINVKNFKLHSMPNIFLALYVNNGEGLCLILQNICRFTTFLKTHVQNAMKNTYYFIKKNMTNMTVEIDLFNVLIVNCKSFIITLNCIQIRIANIAQHFAKLAKQCLVEMIMLSIFVVK